MHPFDSPNGHPPVRGSRPWSPNAANSPPPTDPLGTRRRLSTIRLRPFVEGAAGTLRAIRQVLVLVWGASRLLTMALAGTSLLQSLVPAAQVWLAGQLVQTVADGIASPAAARDRFVSAVVVLALLQLGLSLGSSLSQTVANISQQLLQERMAIHVQLLIMRHATTLDLADFENAAYYDLLQQAERESANRPVQMVSQVFGLVRSTITFGTLIALLVGLGPLIAAATLLAPIPAFVSGSRYGWWGFQQMRRQSPLRRLMSYLSSVVTLDQYAKEIKLFTLGDHFIERYRGVADEYYQGARGLLLRRYWASFAWGSLTVLASAGVFLYVAVRAVQGFFTIGQLTVFTGAATQVQGAFQNVLGGIQGIYENGLYLSSLADLLDRKPAIAAPAHPAPVRAPFRTGIEFRNVTYRYPGTGAAAVQNVSFRIDLGETVALVGRNGAGKTTIVKLLGRLYDPDEGEILIDGRDIREYDPAELRRQFAVMFQDYATYQLTVGENIGVGDVTRIDDEPAVTRAAGRAGADGVIDDLPERYDTPLGKWFERGQQLSGGEWQKIALARAFMREAEDAQILILDEPTAALDARAEHELFARLRTLTTGRMALYISHRFSTVRMADRILVLDEGRLVEQGTHEELLAQEGMYADLFELQAASYR